MNLDKGTSISLPAYACSLRAQGTQQEIYDDLRRLWVALTPEEWVRQHFVHYLMDHLAYPRSMMANEQMLQVGSRRLRCDTILYDGALRPLVLIEYKAPSVALTQAVLEQIVRYNYVCKAPYLIVSNGLVHYAFAIDYQEGGGHRVRTLAAIPPYADLRK